MVAAKIDLQMSFANHSCIFLKGNFVSALVTSDLQLIMDIFHCKVKVNRNHFVDWMVRMAEVEGCRRTGIASGKATLLFDFREVIQE